MTVWNVSFPKPRPFPFQGTLCLWCRWPFIIFPKRDWLKGRGPWFRGLGGRLSFFEFSVFHSNLASSNLYNYFIDRHFYEFDASLDTQLTNDRNKSIKMLFWHGGWQGKPAAAIEDLFTEGEWTSKNFVASFCDRVLLHARHQWKLPGLALIEIVAPLEQNNSFDFFDVPL